MSGQESDDARALTSSASPLTGALLDLAEPVVPVQAWLMLMILTCI
jgi:hypothetical protein